MLEGLKVPVGRRPRREEGAQDGSGIVDRDPVDPDAADTPAAAPPVAFRMAVVAARDISRSPETA